MKCIEPLYRLITSNVDQFPKNERTYLEASFFSEVCSELRNIFKSQYREYLTLIKFTIEMENTMLDANFLCLIMKDILSTTEYTITGMAHYLNINEEILHEIIIGINTNPSAILLQKMIDLHRSVRPELYREIMHKIVVNCTEVA